MAQKIRQGDIFGRIGSGVGKGLAEQLPKEIDRGRLSAGLQEIGQEQGLTPFQKFSKLASLPGTTPQIIQSGSDLLRQEGMLQGSRNIPSKSDNAFESIRNRNNTPSPNGSNGFVSKQNTAAAAEPAIPKSFQELQSRASELNQENPGLYPDYKSAYEGAVNEDTQRLSQNTAQLNARNIQKGLENDIRKDLRGLQSAATAQVPDNVYQKVENEAIADVASGKKTETQATRDARDKLDGIARDYSTINSLGDMTLVASNPSKVRGSIETLRKKFKANDDLENFADQMVAKNGLSNQFAYSLANPPPKEIQSVLDKLPSLYQKPPALGGLVGYLTSRNYDTKDIEEKSLKVSEKLAKMMNKNDSPLAIAQALYNKGYDSDIWKRYLDEHKDELNLSQSQVRELQKTDKSTQGFLNDWWLETMGGF